MGRLNVERQAGGKPDRSAGLDDTIQFSVLSSWCSVLGYRLSAIGYRLSAIGSRFPVLGSHHAATKTFGQAYYRQGKGTT